MRALRAQRNGAFDPDIRGTARPRTAMGRVRSRDFDAVIGIGGIGSKARAAGMHGTENWHRLTWGLLAGRGAIPKPTEIRLPITAGNSSRSITPLWATVRVFQMVLVPHQCEF